MNWTRTWRWLLSSGLGGLLLATGCSSTTNRKWLTFFFDGVPAPAGTTAPGQPEPPALVTTNRPPAVTPVALSQPPMVVHPPYAERNCVACHASNYSQRLKGEMAAVCAACHKAFLVKASFQHAPAQDGPCTLCHAAHQAKEKFLLIKESRELCFDCHAPEATLNNPACGPALDRTCASCHNPHQENHRSLLQARVPKTAPARNATPGK